MVNETKSSGNDTGAHRRGRDGRVNPRHGIRNDGLCKWGFLCSIFAVQILRWNCCGFVVTFNTNGWMDLMTFRGIVLRILMCDRLDVRSHAMIRDSCGVFRRCIYNNRSLWDSDFTSNRLTRINHELMYVVNPSATTPQSELCNFCRRSVSSTSQLVPNQHRLFMVAKCHSSLNPCTIHTNSEQLKNMGAAYTHQWAL